MLAMVVAAVVLLAVAGYLTRRYLTRAPIDGTQSAARVPVAEVSLKSLPLVVDLDGTLLKTHTLWEAFAATLFSRPLATVLALRRLSSGRAAFERRLAELSEADVTTLPVRRGLLDYLVSQHADGRKLYLATSGDYGMASRVAARFDLFAAVHADLPRRNGEGRAGVARMRELFPAGFAYAGNSLADMHLWRGADSVVLAGTGRILTRRARALGKPVEAEFHDDLPRWKVWVAAMRLHQWTKNLLLFVPFALGPLHGDPRVAGHCLAGFVAMGLVASATYLCNDLADLAADRRHHSKRFRPVASGDLSIAAALTVALLLFTVGMWLALALAPAFGATMLVYAAVTLSYSLSLKQVALLDVIILALLYTLRLVLGTLLVGSGFSPWLLTFAAFFFFSLSLAKRHVELVTAKGPPHEPIPGRGYLPSDHLLTLTLGISSGVASILIVVQYLMAEAFPSGLYHLPRLLWTAPVVLCIWICRIWLLAHRGRLHADPVAFAMRDPISLALGGTLGAAFALALTL